MTTRQFMFTVSAPGSYTSWYNALSERNWSAIPTTSGTYRGATFSEVWNGPSGSVGSYGNTASQAFTSWSGACVDTARGDLLMVASGGHTDGWSNAAYALRVRSDQPGWYRLSEGTPASVCNININTASNPWQWDGGTGYVDSSSWTTYHQWPDGRSRAMHTGSSPVFSGDKVWFISQQATNMVGSPDGRKLVSWNRSHVNTSGGQSLPSGPGSAPQPYEQNAGPWTVHGNIGGEFWGSSSGAYLQWAVDPVTGKIFGSNYIDERGWTTKTVRITLGTPPTVETWAATEPARRNMGLAIASDYETTGQDRWRFAVSFSGGPSVAAGSRSLYIWDMKATTPTPTAVTCSDNSWMSFTGYSAFYHPPSRSIIFTEPYWAQSSTATYWGASVAPAYVGKIIKVRVPTNADGSYNSGGTWQVSSWTPTGNPASGLTTGAYYYTAFTKCNLMQMGGTKWALVAALNYAGSAYIMPLPEGDF